MGSSYALIVAALGACGDDLVPPADAAPGTTAFSYQLYLVAAEPADRPPPAVAPTAYIDGVVANALEVVFPVEAAAVGVVHHVELRDGELVVASFDAAIALASCLGRVPTATSYQETLCEYDSGDLRYGGDEATGPSLGCIADSPCAPACSPGDGGCPANERCTSRIVSTSPTASHLGCAPIGPEDLGEACALIADPGGAYDDCGAGLLCTAGTCHTVCTPDCSDACAGCAYVPGNAPEIGICP